MAISIVAVATDAPTSAGTSLTIAKPTGTVDGDLMVAIVSKRDDDGDWAAPDGTWTLLFETTTLEGNDMRFAVFYKIASSEGSSYVFTNSASDAEAGGIITIRGVNPSNPINVHATAEKDDAVNTFTGPSVTTTEDNCLLLMVLTTERFVEGITEPSGSTEQWDLVGGTATRMTNTLATKSQASAGSSGTYTWSATTNLFCGGMFATIAIEPGAIDTPLTVDDGLLNVDGQTINVPIRMAITAKTIQVDGQADVIFDDSPTFPVTSKTVNIDGQTILTAHPLPVTARDIRITGQMVDLLAAVDVTLTVDDATINIIGQTILRGDGSVVTAKMINVDGQTIVDPWVFTNLDPASLEVTGQDVGTDATEAITVDPATIELTGQTLIQSPKALLTPASIELTSGTPPIGASVIITARMIELAGQNLVETPLLGVSPSQLRVSSDELSLGTTLVLAMDDYASLLIDGQGFPIRQAFTVTRGLINVGGIDIDVGTEFEIILFKTTVHLITPQSVVHLITDPEDALE